MFTDTHAHLTSPTILPDLKEIIERASMSGVDKIVNICTDEESLKQGLKLAKEYDWIFNSASTTPHDVETEGELFFPAVVAAAEKKQLVAIGETGLDYFYEYSPRAKQREFLVRYLQLALRFQLPVVFHCREAFEDLFAVTDLEYRDRPAVLHCFTGTIDDARGVIDRGWYISFSGIITFKKSEALREVVRFAPLDRIFIETDSPYLAPQSKRGSKNEPSFISETAATVAAIKGLSVEEIAKITADNASHFFSF